MNERETCRLILGLRKLGLNDSQVLDFLLWVESGDEKYDPQGLRPPTPARGTCPPGPPSLLTFPKDVI